MDTCPRCGCMEFKEYEKEHGGPNPDYRFSYPTCSNCGWSTLRITLRENKKGMTFGEWMNVAKNQIEK